MSSFLSLNSGIASVLNWENKGKSNTDDAKSRASLHIASSLIGLEPLRIRKLPFTRSLVALLGSTLGFALSKELELERTASRRTDLLSIATAADEIACRVA